MTRPFRSISGRPLFEDATVEIIGERHAASLAVPYRPLLLDGEAQTLPLTTSDDIVEIKEITIGCVVCQDMTKLFALNHGHVTDPGLSNGLSEISDEGALTVTVGGSVSGVIDEADDIDAITVDLVAGQTYLISLRGTGADAIIDTYLEVYGTDGSTLIAYDDDGGNDLYSILTITASATGTYTILAGGYPGQGDTGEWTVDVRQRGADESSGIGNAVAMSVGDAVFGFLQPSNESDYYAVTLEAGKIYTIKLAAGADYETNWQAVPQGEVDTQLGLRNSAGVLLASNDDVNFPSDISSALTYIPTVTGTYYVQALGYGGSHGGYILEVEEVNLGDFNPVEAIHWASASNIDTVDVGGVPTAYVYFGAADEHFGETTTNRTYHGWNDKEKSAVMEALLEYSKITGIQYLETADINQAEFRLNTVTGSSVNFGAYFYPQDPAYGTQQGIGIFNVNSGGWDKPGVSTQDIPGDQVSLDRGGFSFAVILHEFGHGHGLSHPHDSGGGSPVMLGVTGSASYGLFNLNQGVYTVMSYNDAWDFHPDGPSPFTIAGISNGWSATLSAFDIAALQARYGVHEYATGDDTYVLSDIQANAFYETIWDSGGNDTILYGGAGSARIDLLAATLDYSATGGGPLSFVDVTGPGIWGGFTIANGVVIENATGGSGNDELIGNHVANVLTGNEGNDSLMGRGGDDTLIGGEGTDTAYYAGARADYSIGLARDENDNIIGFTITDNNDVNGDEGTDTLIDVEAASFSDMTVGLAGTVYLMDGDDVIGVFATIQEAVDASGDGNTIRLSDGVYVEQVVIDGKTGLTIEALPGADVTIQAPADVTQTALSSSGRALNAVVTVVGSTDVVIIGLTVDGNGVANTIDGPNPNFIGVVYRNSSGGLEDVDVIGIRDPYPGGTTVDGYPVVSGNQRGVGVQVDNDALMAFFMHGGSISYFQKNATVFNFADLDISGVTIIGGGAQPVIAQNGIQVVNSTGSISGNIIDAIGYAGASNFIAASILAFTNTDLLITDNVVTGATGTAGEGDVAGIYISGGSGGEVTGNEISSVDYGVIVLDAVTPDSILVEDNTITDLDETGAATGVYFAPDASLAVPHSAEGSDFEDYLSGGASGDTLAGLGGDDVLIGNGGNDMLLGGDGYDTAVYGGNAADYTIVYEYDVDGNIVGFQTVTDNNGGDGDDGQDTLSSVEALQFGDVLLVATQPVHLFDENDNLIATFDTIQDAVNAAEDGYTIRAQAGTYNEIVTINVDVTIMGANAGIAGDGARGPETIINGGVYVNAAGAGATLDGLTIQNGATILGSPAGIYVAGDDVTLTNLVLEGAGTPGMAGILTPFNGGVTGLELSNSHVTGWAWGAYFNPTTQFTVIGNSFDGNGNGFVGDDWASGTFIDGNSFSNSTGSHVGYGVFDTAEDVSEYFGANDFGAGSRPVSIFAYGDGTPGGQTITGTDDDNAIFASEFVPGSGTDSIFNGNGGDDYLYGGSGNDQLNGGDGFDTAVYSGNIADYTIVYQYDGGGNVIGFLSVTDNNAGDGLDEGHDSLSSIEALQFADGMIDITHTVQLFDASDNLIGTFTTIQAAIDAAADGQTIRAAAGTYNEDLVVDVDVSILGANAGIAHDGARGAETIINGGVTVTADGVTLDGVHVAGSITGPGALWSSGIYLTGNDFTVVNSLLDGTGFAAILTGSVTGLDMGFNLVSGSSIGIYVSGGGSTGSIHDNLFQGEGGPIAGLGNGVNSESSGVLIENNTFDGLYAGVINLFPFGPTDVDLNDYVIGNVFTNNAADRPIQIYPTPDSLNFIGTDENESFNADISGVLGMSFFFDGRGGDDRAYGGEQGDTLLGGDGNDRLYGEGGDDVLEGGAGNDILDGGLGVDMMSGGAGDDLYYVDDAGDVVIELSGEGNDRVYASVSYTLAAGSHVERLTTIDNDATDAIDLTGNELANVIYGNAGSNVLSGGEGNDQLYGLEGNDVLNGGLGADIMKGGVGDDQYFVDDAADTVFELSGEGNDRVLASVSYTLTAGQEIERLTTANNAGTEAINLSGNELSQTIYGNAGNNILDGKGGGDLMLGLEGDDSYYVRHASDQVVEYADGGNDRVFASVSYTLTVGSHVERLTTASNAGTDAINLTGNALSQTIYGNAGNNILDGGGGGDLMLGLEGDDSYYVRHASDRVIEYADGGNDRVYATVSYALEAGSHVERLTTSNNGGTSAIDLTGNAFDQIIYGNAGDNVLDGKGGNDTLVGLGGADTFAFTSALGPNNVDRIADFEAGIDRIALDDAIFTGLGLGTLSADAFVVGSAAGDADDRIVYNQATGQLFFDADGSGAGEAILFATLTPGTVLTNTDFIVV